MKLSEQIKERILKKIEESVIDSVKRYSVKKTKHGYKYHNFLIKKDSYGFYDCIENGEPVFECIASFELAILFCYNHLFLHSSDVSKQLQDLNDILSKQKTNMIYYKSCVKKMPERNEILRARINESMLVYASGIKKVRALSRRI